MIAGKQTTVVDVRVGSIAHEEVPPGQRARETERQTTEYVAFLLVERNHIGCVALDAGALPPSGAGASRLQ